jgi:hypothetical protein
MDGGDEAMTVRGEGDSLIVSKGLTVTVSGGV